MKAVVVGGTGAVGQELVGQLLTSGKWATVTTIGRREVQVPPSYTPNVKAKLECVVLPSLDDMASEAGQRAFKGADAAFCTLGTTRKDAGSAEAFIKVDHEYVAETARLAKAAGVPQFSLLTAQGANPNMWACNWAPFHGLLYTKVKGLAEQSARQQGFERLSIFRPGMIDRGDKARSLEKAFMPLLSSIKASDIAACMVADAERDPQEWQGRAAVIYDMAAMQAAAAAGRAPAMPAQ